MATPKSAAELLYDSQATLRLVDNVLDDLRADALAPEATGSPIPHLGLEEIPGLLMLAYREMNGVLDSLRRSRSTLERTSVQKLQATQAKLHEVTSATETAATDILDGLDRAVALVDQLDELGGDEDAALTRAHLRDELFGVMGCMQFQDITTQQLHYASSVLLDLEDRIARLVEIFEPQSLGLSTAEFAPSKPGPRARSAFDPGATTADAEARQALADEIFTRPRPTAL